jgi:hypothetical protein
MQEKRKILIFAIVLSLIVEITLMILVYNRIGSDRLSIHLVRIFFQSFLILLIIKTKSNTALFILAGYHIITGIIHLYSYKSTGFIGNSLMIFHFIVGILIYFHDYFENKLERK